MGRSRARTQRVFATAVPIDTRRQRGIYAIAIDSPCNSHIPTCMTSHQSHLRSRLILGGHLFPAEFLVDVRAGDGLMPALRLPSENYEQYRNRAQVADFSESRSSSRSIRSRSGSRSRSTSAAAAPGGCRAREENHRRSDEAVRAFGTHVEYKNGIGYVRIER